MSNLWKAAPKKPLTTGIGSLPHANVDAALKFSFKLRVPFLPQLPIRNPKEYMVSQALERLPGLVLESGGVTKLDESRWLTGSSKLREETESTFSSSEQGAFEVFEPSAEAWNCWKPFLFELQEQNVSFAKVHIAGPMTCQWALQLTDGSAADSKPEIGMQVFRLILARSIAMARKLYSIGVTPLFYLDEPGFFGFSAKDPKHVLGLSELKLFIQTLQKENVLVGIHCCSNTDWKAMLSLPIDVLSLDTNLSLASVLSCRNEVKRFIGEGGRFSLGIVPTGTHPVKLQAFRPALLLDHLTSTLATGLAGEPELLKNILSTALITPACGLALHSVEDAETILAYTLEVAERYQNSF